MQRIYNYGSSLQSYSLKRLLEGSGQDVEVSFIDYRAGAPLVEESSLPSPSKRILGKVSEYAAINSPKMDKLRFLNHKRRYAKAHFPLLGIPTQKSYDTNVDLQIIGSDEVFNCVQSNTNVGFSRDLFGNDSEATRVISYAASFGNTTISQINEHGIADTLKADFSRFDALSVRDQNSANIIQQLTGSLPHIHVDPVLAYAGLLREPSIPKERLYAEKYVILYGYPGRISSKEGALTRSFARSIGAHVLCFGGVQESADRFIDCSPIELLAYFRDAEAVVTDTFHGSILAIINNVPFATLVRRSTDGGYGNEQKLTHLLEAFELSGRQLNQPSELNQLLSEPLDMGSISRTLAIERERSQTYLSQHLLSHGDVRR